MRLEELGAEWERIAVELKEFEAGKQPFAGLERPHGGERAPAAGHPP